MTKNAYKTDRNFTSFVVELTVVVCLACTLPAGAQTIPGAGIVMTYNVNEGTDFQQVQGTSTVSQFLLGVGQIVTQVEGTNPPERMQAIAQEISELQPELLGLQEVDQWYTGSFDPIANQCGAMSLQYDMLQELLSALSSKGAHYEVAVKVQQYAFPATPGLIPPATFLCEAVNNYNVILARTDLPSSVFQWSNPKSGQFVNKVSLSTPVGVLPLPRAWASVDAQFFGHASRYITTHLESGSPQSANYRAVLNCETALRIPRHLLLWQWTPMPRPFPFPRTQHISTFCRRGIRMCGHNYFPRSPD